MSLAGGGGWARWQLEVALLAAGRNADGEHERDQRERGDAGHDFAFSRARAFAAAALTDLDAVPPRLVRRATEASTASASKMPLVMRGSTICRSASDSSARVQPFFSASRTMVPEISCAFRNGTFRFCTT